MKVVTVRNVNEALDELRRSVASNDMIHDLWVTRQSRNGDVYELDRPMATVYENPRERVSFSRARDANPFFHFFEALWIVAGRDDVAFLEIFNKKMGQYSDDGLTFHAPYGYRLRHEWKRQRVVGIGKVVEESLDQIKTVVKLLSADPDTRRAVMTIWNPVRDLDVASRDIPCNDLIFFKTRQRGGMIASGPRLLDMTVCCRSNDAIWGAYGANAVQFSVLMELVASACALEMGTYTQISDSMHVYTDNDAWQRMVRGHDWKCDLYERNEVVPYPLMNESGLDNWILQAERLCSDIQHATFIDPGNYPDSFFRDVAMPMWKAWWTYKNQNVNAAIEYLGTQELKIDWLTAALRWLMRRVRI